MIRILKKLFGQWRCRHRWRADRAQIGRQWCDLCHARRRADG